MERAKRIRIEADGVVVYADGERIAPLPIDVEVVPDSLRVLAERLTRSASQIWHNRQVVVTAPSYSGLVRRPLTAVTRVRIPLGSPTVKASGFRGLSSYQEASSTVGQ